MAIRPWELERQRGSSAAPSLGMSARLEQDARRGASRGLASLTRRSDNPPAPRPDPGPQGSTAGVSSGTFNYPAVLPPLSPQAQRAFEERRRLATRAYQETAAANERQRLMAEASAVQGRRQIGREQAVQSRDGMSSLASRGVARSPMFVNPFQREVARVAQQRVGELEMGLGQTLENLAAALQQANTDRERELAAIEADMMAERSRIGALLGVV